MKYSLVPKLLDKNKPEDSDAYKTVEDLNTALVEAEEAGVRNIALTGPYGSGKSSILKTLIHDFKDEREYLTISLATLKSDDDLPDTSEEEKEKKRETLNRRIEYSILQQLIYREKSSQVPSSRFKRISHFTKKELIIYSICSVLFILSFFIAFEPEMARIDTLYNFFNWGEINIVFDILAVIYILFCLGYIIRYIIQGYSNSKLNKLNLKDGEIDIKEDTSIFNKHLDEIIYFFRATQYNVVVIEDLDRFETPDIYLKLRELNQLINETKEIKRHITFIYAVKDDVFVDEARTKFFDYIVSIIPVINPSNSKAILKKELLATGLNEGEISDDDIAEIAFFIQDMRILQNIVHEFSDYRCKLSKGEQQLNLAKLLAIIVYKNYHPKDFALLHRREGKVYECIKKKEDFINIYCNNLIQKKKELEDFEKQNKLTLEDLRLLFLYEIADHLPYKGLDAIKIENEFISLRFISQNKEYFQKILNLSSINYRYQYYNGKSTHTHSINVQSLFNNSKLKDRIDFITSDVKISIKKDIEYLNKEIQQIKDKSISSIISNNNVKESDTYKEIKLSEMMEVFLIEGYLDEDYYDYISYFYPGMISPADREYLMAIKRLKKPNYYQHIDKLENFIKELRTINFENESILNLELLDFLVKHRTENLDYNNYLSRIKSIISKEDINISFLSSYYQNSKSANLFFESFLQEDDNLIKLWNEVYVNQTEEQAVLIECILKYGRALNETIFKWLENNYEFIKIHKDKIGSSRIGFINQSVKYNALDLDDIDLITKIIKHNAYAINTCNIKVILSSIYPNREINEVDLSFDLIRNCSSSPTRDYFLSDEHLPITYKSLSGKYKHESLESIEFLLSSNLTDEEKLDYLSGQHSKRLNLEGLEENQIKILIKSNTLLPSWENVNSIYGTYKNDENILSNYIKTNWRLLSKEDSAIGISREDEIFDFLFGNNTILTIEEYDGLINAFDVACAGEDYLPKLDTSRFRVLLNNKCLPFNKENLDIFSGSTYYSDFLIYHHSKFIENLDWEYSLTFQIILDLLTSEKFSSKEKNLILEKVGFKEISQNPKLTTLAAEIIAKNLPDTKFTINEIRGIISNSSDLKSNILLVNYILPSEDLDEDDVSDILKSLNSDKISLIAERKKQPKLKKTQLIEKLLQTLITKHFISSTSDNEEYIWPNYFRSSN